MNKKLSIKIVQCSTMNTDRRREQPQDAIHQEESSSSAVTLVHWPTYLYDKLLRTINPIPSKGNHASILDTQLFQTPAFPHIVNEHPLASLFLANFTLALPQTQQYVFCFLLVRDTSTRESIPLLNIHTQEGVIKFGFQVFDGCGLWEWDENGGFVALEEKGNWFLFFFFFFFCKYLVAS
jgi:hypothetical protein